MADSAFTPPTLGAPTTAAPVYDDPTIDMTTIQETPQQIDPNYSANQAAIEEANKVVLPESKLEIKTKNLNQKLIDKQKKVDGTAPEAPAEDNDGRIGELVDLVQSAAVTTGADLLDTGVEIGSNLLGGLADLSGQRGVSGQNGPFSVDDQKAVNTALDPYTEAAFGDKFAGYSSRGNYQAAQQEVGKLVENGEYLDAFLKGATIAPEMVAESIPYIATLGVGSRLKMVKAAGAAAKTEAAALNGTKAMQAKAYTDAVKRAEDALSLPKKFMNATKNNAGLLAMSTTQTKNQNEEFKKNNNGEGMSPFQMIRSTGLNILTNGLDRFTFKTVTGIGKAAKDIKPVWGSLDKQGKHIIKKKVFGIAADMGKEAGQEYLQEWGQIVNENWGAAGQSLSDVLGNSGGQNQALTSALLGASSGGLMSAPGTTLSTLNAVGAKKKLKAQNKAALSTVTPGYADAADKAKHEEVVTKDYDSSKGSFEDLAEVEKVVAETAADETLDSSTKIGRIQRSITNNAKSDSATDVLVKGAGFQHLEKLKDLLKGNTAISGNKQAMALINSKMKEAKGNFEQINAIKTVLSSLKSNGVDLGTDFLTNINKEFSDAITEADELVARHEKDGLLNITYNDTRNALNREGSKQKQVKEAIIEKGAPKTELDVPIETLLDMKPKELKKKLAEFDTATLGRINTAMAKERKKEKSVRATVARNPDTGRLSKAISGAKSAISTSPSRKVKKEASNIIKSRVAGKALYDPKAPLFDRVKKSVIDKIDSIQKRADEVRDGMKKGFTGANNAEVNEAATATVKAVNNLDQIEDPTILQEVVGNLETIGKFTKPQADKLRKKLKDHFEAAQKKAQEKVDKLLDTDFNIDPAQVNKDFKTKLDALIQTSKTAKRADVIKAFNDFISTMDSKLNPTERAVVLQALTSLIAGGKFTQTYADKIIDTLFSPVQGPKEYGPEDTTKAKELKAKASEAAKKAKDLVAETAKKLKDGEISVEDAEKAVIKGIGDAVTKAKETAQKAKEKVTDSELGAEVVKDSKALYEKLLTTLGDVDIKTSYQNLTNTVAEADYLGMYKSLKDLATLSDNGRKVTVTTKVVDSNNKPILKNNEEVC